MAFWVYGRDAATGQARDPLFVEAESEEAARASAVAAGLIVDEVEDSRADRDEEKVAVKELRRPQAVGAASRAAAAQPEQDPVVAISQLGERLLAPLRPYRRHIAILGCIIVGLGAMSPLLRVKDQTVSALLLPNFGGPVLVLMAIGLVFAVRYSATALVAVGLCLLALLMVEFVKVNESNSQYVRLKSLGADAQSARMDEMFQRAPSGAVDKGSSEQSKLQRELARLQSESDAARARMVMTGAWPFEVTFEWAWYPLFGGAMLVLLAAGLRPRVRSG
jgi:hypothetical protein